MPTWMKRIAAVKLIVFATFAIVFLVGMRRKDPRVLGTVRSMNRRVFNPGQMQTAGSPGAYASIVHHVGRASGTAYRTPVGVAATDDGVVIALPYGERADWVQNVLAAERATIVHDGETFEVVEPAVVPMSEVLGHFSDQEQRVHRWFAVDQALRLSRAAVTSAPPQR